jgi:hypothetical protein
MSYDLAYQEFIRIKIGLEDGTISDLEAAVYDVPTAQQWAEQKIALKAAVAKYQRPKSNTLIKKNLPQVTFNNRGYVK